MNQQAVNHGQEFDESVAKYNEWLASSEDSKVQRRNNWKDFLKGMGSVLDIFGNYFSKKNMNGHPLYSRVDLTAEQKDSIGLASDWQRVDRNLDKIILGDSSNGDISVEDAKAGKQLIQQMYDNYKNVYISHTLK
ncbi:MAG: hypothetical protein ABIB43_04775 [archaeon]